MGTAPSIRHRVAAAIIAKATIVMFNAHTMSSDHVDLAQALSGLDWPLFGDRILKLLLNSAIITGQILRTTIICEDRVD